MSTMHLSSSWWPLVKAIGRFLIATYEVFVPYVFFYLAITGVAPGLPTWDAVMFAVWSTLGVACIIDNREKK